MSESSKLTLSIVVPVYNSEEVLEELVRQIKIGTTQLNMNVELILINDYSKDSSWLRINHICEQEAFLTIKSANLTKNFGQDCAIMAGLSISLGDYVVIMDDDLQHNPADIGVMLNQLVNSDADVCFANYSEKKSQSWWKNIGSYMNSVLGNVVLHKPIGVYLSPYKIIKRRLVDHILNYHGPYPYIDGLILRSTGYITQISVKHGSRFAGESSYTLFKSISTFLRHATGFSVVPLRISSMVGLMSSFFGFLLGVKYIFDYYVVGISVEGWTTLVVLLLFVGGAILASLGMLGEYVGRIYLTLTCNPQYAIKEIITNVRK